MKSKIIQTIVECVLAIIIFGGIGVMLANAFCNRLGSETKIHHARMLKEKNEI